MKTKDLVYLLLPSLYFVIMSIAGFAIGSGSLNKLKSEQTIESQRKFEWFVENVKNGRWQLTTDKWIEGMRRERAVAEAHRKATLSALELLQVFGWAALLGFAFHLATIFSFRAKLQKQTAQPHPNY